MNPRFAVYFFRSKIFQSQVEREKRGIGNMTNIFPSQVGRMFIVACDREQQEAIVNAISAALEEVARARSAIDTAQANIQRLVDTAIAA
jgi:type I restriction enzyme S subunit